MLDSSADGKLYFVRFIVVPNNNPIMEFALKFEPDEGSMEYMLFNLDYKYQDKGIDDLVNLVSVILLESYGGSIIRVGHTGGA